MMWPGKPGTAAGCAWYLPTGRPIVKPWWASWPTVGLRRPFSPATWNGERARVVEALNAGRVKVLVATGQLIGEGFDCRELSTLFLATPIRFNGRLLQYLGRVLRPAPGRTRPRCIDYLDPVGVLENAARARERVYEG
jgi:superfamily II DNA or RNA helicase